MSENKTPETLPSAPSIRKMVEERRRATKKRQLKVAKQDEQPALFDDPKEAQQ